MLSISDKAMGKLKEELSASAGKNFRVIFQGAG